MKSQFFCGSKKAASNRSRLDHSAIFGEDHDVADDRCPHTGHGCSLTAVEGGCEARKHVIQRVTDLWLGIGRLLAAYRARSSRSGSDRC